MRVMMVVFLISIAGCGSSTPAEDTQSCQASSKTFSGCCSGHEGASTTSCQAGEFVFTSAGKLVCVDGSVSASCTK